MERYRYKLKDQCEVELSCSPDFDNIISKYKDNELIEHDILWNCEIVSLIPWVLRYCFEQGVDLKKRKFLRNLPASDYEIDDFLMSKAESDFKTPLRTKTNAKGVSSIDNKLVICCNGRVSFDSEDVPEFVEGSIRVLDWEGIRLAQIRCIQLVHHYHKCLDKGILSHPV